MLDKPLTELDVGQKTMRPPIDDLVIKIRRTVRRMERWDRRPVSGATANKTWGELGELTVLVTAVPACDLASLKAKATALELANMSAIHTDDDPGQTDVEALLWSLIRDIQAMA